MKIKIKVTKEILERSKYCGSEPYDLISTNCAVALAMRDLFPDASVGAATFGYGVAGYGQCNLPMAMRGFIQKFDEATPEMRVKMCEREFEIDVPEAVIESIGLSEVHRILKDSKTLELA